MKTKSEQLEDFKTFKCYADKDCKECHGSGNAGWIEDIKIYRPCTCVFRNIREELEDKSKIRETLIN